MKIVHLSDLHLGKQVNGFSMIEDQKYILDSILLALRDEKPDAIVIAGDVYDKSVPSAEAVTVCDDFLNRLVGLESRPQVFVISGNHDSAERLAFGNRLMARSGVHLSPVFDGKISAEVMSDEYGEVEFHLLPFLKPSDARYAYSEAKIENYTDAVREALAHAELDPSRRHVLIAHQFVTGTERSESEDVTVGGLDNVDAAVFDGFDYVALGHLHRPQAVPGRENVRYCGTPLKYSFSELNDCKGIQIVELGPKGTVEYRTIPLKPLHDMREIKGTYEELTLRENYQGTVTDDYIHAILTDEDDVIDALGRLRAIYPNLMKLEYVNRRTTGGDGIASLEGVPQKSDMEILGEFYEMQNNKPLSEEQRQFAESIFNNVQEGRA
jgi:exonuclease SbcD